MDYISKEFLFAAGCFFFENLQFIVTMLKQTKKTTNWKTQKILQTVYKLKKWVQTQKFEYELKNLSTNSKNWVRSQKIEYKLKNLSRNSKNWVQTQKIENELKNLSSNSNQIFGFEFELNFSLLERSSLSLSRQAETGP